MSAKATALMQTQPNSSAPMTIDSVLPSTTVRGLVHFGFSAAAPFAGAGAGAEAPAAGADGSAPAAAGAPGSAPAGAAPAGSATADNTDEPPAAGTAPAAGESGLAKSTEGDDGGASGIYDRRQAPLAELDAQDQLTGSMAQAERAQHAQAG